jgi:hypothetical protein
MGDESARPDVVQVVCETRSAGYVQVFVVVLDEVPLTASTPAVVLAVSGLDLDWKVLARGVERELEQSSYSG